MKRSRAKAAASRSAITLGMLINILMSMGKWLLELHERFRLTMLRSVIPDPYIVLFRVSNEAGNNYSGAYHGLSRKHG